MHATIDTTEEAESDYICLQVKPFDVQYADSNLILLNPFRNTKHQRKKNKNCVTKVLLIDDYKTLIICTHREYFEKIFIIYERDNFFFYFRRVDTIA